MRHTPLLVLALAAAGCDYSGDWLFHEPIETLPGVLDLGQLEVSDIENTPVDEAVVYGEIGPPSTANLGGITFMFQGTGSTVCAWVDPELVTWNLSVGSTTTNPRWTYPDNVTDDGDLDLDAGQAVYYAGSPGVEMGDFEVLYEDPLGNRVPIEFSQCVIKSLNDPSGGHSGRGRPEFCEIEATQPGVNYLVALEAWSTPIDDGRLGYGILLFDAGDDNCNLAMDITDADDIECVIRGEALRAEDHDYRESPKLGQGLSAVEQYAIPGAMDFESTFCLTNAPGPDNAVLLHDFCVEEARALADEGKSCDDEDVNCFCGDPTDTPDGTAG